MNGSAPPESAAPTSSPSIPGLFISTASVPSLVLRREALLARISRTADRVGLVLLMLAIGTLLFRPSDVIPALEGASLYELCMVLCIVAALPRLVSQLGGRALREHAISALLVTFVFAILLSHLMRGDTWNARLGGIEAAKACILFLLVVGLVDTATKLRAMLLATAGSVLAVTILALLNYHGLVSIPSMESVVQPGNEEGAAPLLRLCATGIFNDPNDYSLMLVLCESVCVYALSSRALGPKRMLVIVPAAIFAYALWLTHSRGGLMSGAAAALAFVTARYGWRNALPLMGLLSLLLLAPFWGRQTAWNLQDPDDTFQARLDLWSSALDSFRDAPLFGVGQGKLVDEIGQVAHNSYLHAFAELGLVGGTIFIGAFWLAIRGLWRASPLDHAISRLRPCVLAITLGYAAGLLTLTRCYTVPTQLVMALATVYLRLASTGGVPVEPRLDRRTLRVIVLAAAAFLAMTYVFVRIMLHR